MKKMDQSPEFPLSDYGDSNIVSVATGNTGKRGKGAIRKTTDHDLSVSLLDLDYLDDSVLLAELSLLQEHFSESLQSPN